MPKSSIPLLVGILLSCALPQLIGGIIAYRRNEILLAIIFGLFVTVITLGAVLTLYQQIFMAPKPGAFTLEVMGVFWFILFILAILMGIGFGRVSWLLCLGIIEIGVAFLFVSINAWTGSLSALKIAGWLFILFAVFCIYFSTALLYVEHFERPILPLGKPIFK